MTDQQKESAKSRIAEYITAKGHHIEGGLTRCISSQHADNNPSCQVGDAWFKCHSCGVKGDIFAAAALFTGGGFKDQVADVCATLGIVEERNHIPDAGKKAAVIVDNGQAKRDNAMGNIEKLKKKLSPTKPVPVPPDQRHEIFTMEAADRLRRFAEEKKPGSWGDRITNTWPYRDVNGDYVAYDIRCEGGERNKNVITLYYNGKTIKSAKAPVFIYNLYNAIQAGDKIVFHEGAKCAKLARIIPGFTHCSWSGGGKKASKVKLKPLVDAGITELWYYPDSDLKTDSAGNLLPWDRQPGMITARDFQNHCRSAGITCYIIPFMEGLADDGDDIEQALEIYTPDQIAEHFTTAPPVIFPPPALPAPAVKPVTTYKPKAPKGLNPDAFPFDILGTGDDGLTYFVGRGDRMWSWSLPTIGKKQLLTLAEEAFWTDLYPHAGKSWNEPALDHIIEFAVHTDFDPDTVKGRGAYWGDDNEPYYFDGRDYIGTPSTKLVHLRKQKKDIGLKDKPASLEIRQAMRDVAAKLSFATPSHMVRSMAWGALAQFCGLYRSRPPLLFTGDPGSGKSYIAEKVIKVLSESIWVDVSSSTAIGVTSKAKGDAVGIIGEEAEGDTPDKAKKRDEFYSVMRGSYCENSPRSFKGTQDGGYRSVDRSCMFMFVAVDPSIANAPDLDRIFRVYIKDDSRKGETKEDRVKRFHPIDVKIRELFTEENARAVRAFTWQNIKLILESARKMEENIAKASGQKYRYCQAEALLLAGYLVVFEGVGPGGFTDDRINKFLKEFYSWSPVEEKTTATSQMLDRILQHVVKIDRYRSEFTIYNILEILRRGFYERDPAHIGDDTEIIERDLKPFKSAIGNIGLAMVSVKGIDRKCLAVMNYNHALTRATGWTRGYDIQLKRHKSWVGVKLNPRNCNIPGQGSKPCTVLDIFKEDE